MDADGTVGQLLQFHGTRDAEGVLEPDQDASKGVTYFSIQDKRERDRAFPLTRAGYVAGAVRPAYWRHLVPLSTFDAQRGFFEHCGQHGYRVSFVNVITPMLASNRTVAAMLERFSSAPNADFVLVKNRVFGAEDDAFERFDTSRGRDELSAHGGVEIDLPAMRMRTYASWTSTAYVFRRDYGRAVAYC